MQASRVTGLDQYSPALIETFLLIAQTQVFLWLTIWVSV